MTLLTAHFSLEELLHSDTAVRLGIDNTPPPEILPNLRTLAEGLERARAIIAKPIHVNSGYRCEELERVIARKDYAAWCARRGRPESEAAWAEYFARKAHPKGFAADWTAWAFGSPLAIIRKLVAESLEFDQLIQEGTWVHASFAATRRRQVLTAHFQDGVPSYTQGT